ncbi:fosfomycin resistance glutathione transferase [Gynuella sunshinyii]|uniref:Lactoylglutathione lyase and related lyase n=1 Tax=Gynuella sunshinyii YC6258 TaxID=1445510 RepID=A0A0C5VX53_9GAMM|nr:fosfomycin resistance glutathione transferase [Gynuella sunshinyii]AJQ97903.1 lactoylglutathione lyase and related lyase [Gynuella sunshinyii YC6258]
MITQLNHLTLAVSELDRAFRFYTVELGLTPHVRWQTGAYLSAGELWLCLSVDPDTQAVQDYTHVAFSVSESTFAQMRARLINAGVTVWKQNRSEGESFYFLDPDGHKLELHLGSLDTRLAALRKQPYPGLEWF